MPFPHGGKPTGRQPVLVIQAVPAAVKTGRQPAGPIMNPQPGRLLESVQVARRR